LVAHHDAGDVGVERVPMPFLREHSQLRMLSKMREGAAT
jgi:hypothetical protein